MGTPFSSIALCFSGGGYRAACFSLGVLSFFEKIKLLNDVKAISTVSGGTITGVKYAQSQFERKTFIEFFKEYYQWLKDDELSGKAVSHIKGTKVWNLPENKHKRKNPINAFAIEYNKALNNTTLGNIEDIILNKNTHLERVVFNATDFSTATPFRFQNVKGTGFRFGNSESHNYKSLVGQIKLGDILASSSAFPGGFEPIRFPHDFVSGEHEEIEIGLMDGGILDNQGTSAFIKSNPKNNPHDLIFVCDVASPYIEPFGFAKKNKLTKILNWLSSFPVLIFTAVLTIISLKYQKWFLYTLGTVLTTFMLVLQVVFYFASKELKKATGIEQNLIIPPDRFGVYLIDRAKSLLKMAGEVFLKNDRRQNTTNIYKDYWKIMSTAAIYELRCEKDGKDINKPENAKQWDKIKKHTGDISDNIKKVAKESSSFGTTLWFSKLDAKKNTLDKLIACGEFTACYNLIAYLVRRYPDDIQNRDSEQGKLFEQLLLEWKDFKNDPFFLVKRRKM